MNRSAKKIEAAAKVEGEESLKYIKCDLDDSKGHPIAVLYWPSSTDPRHVCHEIDPSELSKSETAGVDYIYIGNPIPIPKTLAEMRPAPLSDEGFRLGFFFLPEN